MNKIYVILFLSFICVNICGASTDSRKAFIKKYKDIAIEEMDRTGIPASIKLAQGILESGCGKSQLAINANNHFGINATIGMALASPWTMINEMNVSGNTGTRKNHGLTTVNFCLPVPATPSCSTCPKQIIKAGQKD